MATLIDQLSSVGKRVDKTGYYLILGFTKEEDATAFIIYTINSDRLVWDHPEPCVVVLKVETKAELDDCFNIIKTGAKA